MSNGMDSATSGLATISSEQTSITNRRKLIQPRYSDAMRQIHNAQLTQDGHDPFNLLWREAVRCIPGEHVVLRCCSGDVCHHRSPNHFVIDNQCDKFL